MQQSKKMLVHNKAIHQETRMSTYSLKHTKYGGSHVLPQQNQLAGGGSLMEEPLHVRT